MGQILAPRIFSSTVGVHPIVAIFALFAGAELFGLLGGFLAIPVAGVLQHIVVAFWHRWVQKHPEKFPQEEVPINNQRCCQNKSSRKQIHRPWSKTMRVSLKQLVGKCTSTMILLWRYSIYGA